MFDRKSKLAQQILDQTPDAVYVIAADRKIRAWNKGAERLTGYAAEEAVGRRCTEDLPGHQDEHGNRLCEAGCLLESCSAEGGPARRNLFLRKKDGGRVFVEAHVGPLARGAGGGPDGVIVSCREVSRFSDLRLLQFRHQKIDRLIPICGWCKKIRNADEAWEQIEAFLSSEGLGDFTHTICPVCAEKIFSKKIYLESYQSICREISGSLSLDEVLALIVKNVVKVMNVKASLVRLLNREGDKLEVAAYHGLSESYVKKGPVTADASIEDALAGKAVSVYDITADASAQYRAEAVREGIRSILSIPLRSADGVIGVLRMYTAEPMQYTDEDMKFVSAIADQAAIAIMNARHFEKTVSREREYLDIFQAVTKTISSTLDVNEVLTMIVRMIPAVMRLRAATIRLLDDTGSRLVLAAAHGLSERYLSRGPVDTEENIREALNEKPVAIYDVMTDDRIAYKKEAEEEGIKSVLTLPIAAHGRVIGVLRLLATAHRTFGQDEIDFAVSLAEQCGIAIENARMYGRLSGK
ncbi:MAG: hypothetical protein OHK006_09480 [Thermodesulfovibrionales bacterium]